MADDFSFGEADPVLCFQHCHKGTNIFCHILPVQCPLCRGLIKDTPMRIPPFRIPSPFCNAHRFPASVVVKPTNGTFLKDYNRHSNLHIGLTDANGAVYDYDETGVHLSDTGWAECLAIQLTNDSDDSFKNWWNVKLKDFSKQPQWSVRRYHEISHNCYDFVLGFLQYTGMDKQVPSVKQRTQFVQEMILPKTSQAGKYIAMYRRVAQDGLLVQTKSN